MKKLYRNILLFLLPMGLFIILLPIDKRLKYQGLKNDCFNHGSWIYDRLYANDKPVNIAFVGSSHTINGMDDRLISEHLTGKKKQAVNFGYCRLGRNLQYVLIKEIVKTKHPQQIIIEVREDENRYGHPIFSYLADTKDVVLAPPFFNRDYFADIWKHFSYQLELFQDKLFHDDIAVPMQRKDFGFSTSPDTAQIGLSDTLPSPLPDQSTRDFYMKYPRTYLSQIAQFCQKFNIRLTFLYLPAFGSMEQKPLEFNFYQRLGEVWMPPDSIMKNPNHWYDHDHLNLAGAEKLSYWIAKKMNQTQVDSGE